MPVTTTTAVRAASHQASALVRGWGSSMVQVALSCAGGPTRPVPEGRSSGSPGTGFTSSTLSTSARHRALQGFVVPGYARLLTDTLPFALSNEMV